VVVLGDSISRDEDTTMTPETDIEQAVRRLEACRAGLRARIEQTKHDLDAVERSIQLLRSEVPEPLISASHNLLRYAELLPQAAVVRFFSEHASQAFKPSAIAGELRRLGCVPKNHDPNVYVTQVRTACLRLVEKNILEQTFIEGKVAFQVRKSTENP
jgi:hypothetical protein